MGRALLQLFMFALICCDLVYVIFHMFWMVLTNGPCWKRLVFVDLCRSNFNSSGLQDVKLVLWYALTKPCLDTPRPRLSHLYQSVSQSQHQSLVKVQSTGSRKPKDQGGRRPSSIHPMQVGSRSKDRGDLKSLALDKPLGDQGWSMWRVCGSILKGFARLWKGVREYVSEEFVC